MAWTRLASSSSMSHRGSFRSAVADLPCSGFSLMRLRYFSRTSTPWVSASSRAWLTMIAWAWVDQGAVDVALVPARLEPRHHRGPRLEEDLLREPGARDEPGLHQPVHLLVVDVPEDAQELVVLLRERDLPPLELGLLDVALDVLVLLAPGLDVLDEEVLGYLVDLLPRAPGRGGQAEDERRPRRLLVDLGDLGVGVVLDRAVGLVEHQQHDVVEVDAAVAHVVPHGLGGREDEPRPPPEVAPLLGRVLARQERDVLRLEGEDLLEGVVVLEDERLRRARGRRPSPSGTSPA